MKRTLEGLFWKYVKKRMGYSDHQMELFHGNPRNEDVLALAPLVMSKRIVIEIVESHGCNSKHRKGDKLYFDGVGNLLTGLCPNKVCIYALNAIVPLIFAANELLYAGADPNGIKFKRVACFDTGVECGGFGRIIMEITVEDL